MGRIDELCDTGLVLGLGFSSTAIVPAPKTELRKPAPVKGRIIIEPNLTLGLSGDSCFVGIPKKPEPIRNKVMEEHSAGHTESYGRQTSPHSTLSSFSSPRMKRERELSGEEVEVERVTLKAGDEEDIDGINARKKLRLTKEQSALLEESFKEHSNLNPKQKQALARQLSLRPRQVEVWFQNRRARTKLKQTEVDCELLKKCCETLTDENRRLQKELQELKAMKLAQPFYMRMPAATLNMCPSCERVLGDGAGAKGPFSMTPKSHFYNPFNNPPAAC